MPGVGFTLGVVILTEVGDVRRFPDAEHLATYAGTTPRIHSSGGKTRFGYSNQGGVLSGTDTQDRRVHAGVSAGSA